MSEASFDSGAEGFWAHMLVDTWGSLSDAVPLEQGASITCAGNSPGGQFVLKIIPSYGCSKSLLKRN